MMVSFSSDFSEDINNRLHLILGTYESSLREETQRARVPIANFPILRPHNRFVGVDSGTIHIVLSLKDTSPTSRQEIFRDLRARGGLNPQSLVDACRREFGFEDIQYLSFPEPFLVMPEQALKEKIRAFASSEVMTTQKRIAELLQAGFQESYQYLQNARIRLSSGTPEGFADCIANCRNSLVSAVKAVTGQESIRNGIKEMAKQGYFGEREQELFEAMEYFMAKLYNMLSKAGPHPPMPSRLQAEFALGLTDVSLTFLTNVKVTRR